MKQRSFIILLVDDDENDRVMIERAFRKVGINDEIHFATCGQEAVAYLSGQGQFADRHKFPFPSMVMTDLKMPNGNGFSLLRHLKEHPDLKIIPVLVLSASDDPHDIQQSYSLGANCYLRKPTTPTELQRLLKLFHDFWKDCHVPETDPSGHVAETSSEGKLGARYATQ